MAAAALTLSSCDATGDVVMFETCEMKLEALSGVQSGPLLFQVIASKQMCIDAAASEQNPWPFAASLLVTNTGKSAVALTHGEGSLGPRAFRMGQMTEVLSDGGASRAGGSDGGPVDPNTAKTVEVSLAPGASHKVVGDPRYILKPVQRTVDGESLSGLPVPDADRMLRNFKLDFMYWVNVDGKDVTGEISAPLTVMLKPQDG